MPPVFPPLQEGAILAHLSAASAPSLNHLSLLVEVGSTNAWLLQQPASDLHAHAVLAEQQTAGRGRRGRAWQSPPGSNIYLSLGWIFGAPAQDLSCLPLAVGVAVVRALESLGISGVGLKWPNDIQSHGRKLGGILLESRPAGGGRAAVVIGIGINVAMPPTDESTQTIDQPWIAITELVGPVLDTGLRDRLAGVLLDQVLQSLPDYAESGFEPFQADWQRLDLLLNQTVKVVSAESEINGLALGIDQQGNLRVAEEFGNGQQRLHCLNSAEVSVRKAGPPSDEE